jgi:hypothetical protein
VSPEKFERMLSLLKIDSPAAAFIRSTALPPTDLPGGGSPARAEFVRAKLEIDSILSEFRLAPVLLCTRKHGWIVDWCCVGRHPQDAKEVRALLKLLTLASADLLGRVRQCSTVGCERWFYARRGNEKFCSAPCEQRLANSDPDRKEKKRLYMRKYRRSEKARDQKCVYSHETLAFMPSDLPTRFSTNFSVWLGSDSSRVVNNWLVSNRRNNPLRNVIRKGVSKASTQLAKRFELSRDLTEINVGSRF